MNDFADQQISNMALQARYPSSGRDPFSEGLYILGLTKAQIDEYGYFLDNFYQRMRDSSGKQITRTASTMLQGAIFAIGTRELQNPEWEEHCASSLREILHEWSEGKMEADFNSFYRDKGNKLNGSEKEVFKEFRSHYNYFTGIAHHNASTILGALSYILKNNSLKIKDCYADDVFLGRVKNFFLILAQIIDLSRE